MKPYSFENEILPPKVFGCIEWGFKIDFIKPCNMSDDLNDVVVRYTDIVLFRSLSLDNPIL
jgi:hypothetical protein